MRIITGRAKGLKLKTHAGFSTRPTSDRVKESLFNILNGLIDFTAIGAVLDIFAGTGALGLESISRGAHSATFIDAATTDIIRDNATRAKFLDECKILRGDFTKILQRLNRQGATFNLIFSDPPYEKGFAQSSLKLVAELNLLAEDGLMIIEHGIKESIDVPPNMNLLRQVSFGHTTTIEIFFKEKTS